MLGSGLGATVSGFAASLATSRLVAGPLAAPSLDLATAGPKAPRCPRVQDPRMGRLLQQCEPSRGRSVDVESWIYWW